MKTTNKRATKGKVIKREEGPMPALINFQIGRKLREEVKTLSDSKAKQSFELNKVIQEQVKSKDQIEDLYESDIEKSDLCCQDCDTDCECTVNLGCECDHDCSCPDLFLGKECDNCEIILNVEKLLT